MKTTAIRLYGKKDLRMEEFELPQIKENEILAKVVSDSLCMSSYKASTQGTDHKRIPADVAENPIIIGHEFAGELVASIKDLESDPLGLVFRKGDENVAAFNEGLKAIKDDGTLDKLVAKYWGLK